MDCYEAECALARCRISDLGRDPDDFSFVMSLLPPDPDAGGMYTVQYDVKITSRATAKSITVTGGIGWDWVSVAAAAIDAGKLD